MRQQMQRTAVVVAGYLASACGEPAQEREARVARASTASISSFRFPNGSGTAETLNASGGPVVDLTNPFFQALGTNGRSCATCHVVTDGMTVTPAELQFRFAATAGLDPIFRLVDGSNSPRADVSTVNARRVAYGMLLTRGLIRIGLPIPSGAEFALVSVQDPYGYASAAELSLFRRPLPATNLKFLSTVMWDGRETFKDRSQPTGFAPLAFDLEDQSNAATLGHAQGSSPLTAAQRQAIVAFELQLFTAQVEDALAGDLTAAGATGGPGALSSQGFFFGINDPLGGNPSGAPFNPVVMTEYSAWSGSTNVTRAAIARGEDLFNNRPISITGVSGLNDDLAAPVIAGTCTTCHDTPHAGDHSVPAPLRIGTDDPSPSSLDATGLPVYTLQNVATGEIKTTTDPGRALITGKWRDVGRFKGPILRGLASRPPYFHNGSASDLATVVRFYDSRFGLGLSAHETSDLVAFLGTL